LALTRLLSGDIVVAGYLDVGVVRFPDLGGASDLAYEPGSPEQGVVLARISAQTRAVLWTATIRGDFARGLFPRVTMASARDGNGFAVAIVGYVGDLSGSWRNVRFS
jgi:hypothetical protein